MLFNYMVGLIIPWIFGIWLFYRDKKAVVLIAPFASIISHTINAFGLYFGLWKITPVKLHTFAILPFD